MLKEGTLAPNFNLPDKDGALHSLGDCKGKWVLIYFYPKDDTPGCAKEACSFRDNLPNFEKLDAQIFGISADSVKSHARFSDKFGLNFILLSDPSREVVKIYEAGESSTKRISYLIDPDGKIFKAYQKVKPDVHAEEALQDLQIAKARW